MRCVYSSLLLAAVVAFVASPAGAADWWQWLGQKRDAVWDEKGLTTKFPKDGPPVVWRQSIGAGHSGPAVVGDKLFITDRVKTEPDPKNPPPKGTLSGKEQVHCLNIADGKTI